MTMACVHCANSLDHCHGTLVNHPDGVLECTDQGCRDLDRARHDLVVDCELLVGGCGCDQAEPKLLRVS